MKTIFLAILAAAALGGCAYYGAPYPGYGYGYPGAYYGGYGGYGYAYPSVNFGVYGGDWGDGYRRGWRGGDRDGWHREGGHRDGGHRDHDRDGR